MSHPARRSRWQSSPRSTRGCGPGAGTGTSSATGPRSGTAPGAGSAPHPAPHTRAFRRGPGASSRSQPEGRGECVASTSPRNQGTGGRRQRLRVGATAQPLPRAEGRLRCKCPHSAAAQCRPRRASACRRRCVPGSRTPAGTGGHQPGAHATPVGTPKAPPGHSFRVSGPAVAKAMLLDPERSPRPSPRQPPTP